MQLFSVARSTSCFCARHLNMFTLARIRFAALSPPDDQVSFLSPPATQRSLKPP